METSQTFEITRKTLNQEKGDLISVEKFVSFKLVLVPFSHPQLSGSFEDNNLHF